MINVLDLFAGCGGLTEGFKQVPSYNLIAAVEWEKSPADTLVQRLSSKWGYKDASDRVLHFDIQRIDELFNGFSNDPKYGSSIGLTNLINNEKVNLIIGGPPCQAYSVAGRIRCDNGMQDDYRNYLFESYLRVVERLQPDACIFENVPGMLSAKPGGEPIVDRVIKAFNNRGYEINTNLKAAIFDTSHFGVPQKRKRVIIAAFRRKSFPNATRKVEGFYNTLAAYSTPSHKTVAEALKGLPAIIPLSSPSKSISHKLEPTAKTFLNHNPRFHNQRDIEIFKILAEDIETATFRYASSEALKKLYTEKTGKNSSVHKYYVLRKNQPSNTIPAHLYKDGLRHIHPDPKQARSITVREAARLQSFPDDFKFTGSMGANYKMIGNAVPPAFAKLIAQSLKEVLC